MNSCFRVPIVKKMWSRTIKNVCTVCSIRTVHFSNLANKKVCIVGSGPAGFYTAQHLIKVVINVPAHSK